MKKPKENGKTVALLHENIFRTSATAIVKYCNIFPNFDLQKIKLREIRITKQFGFEMSRTLFNYEGLYRNPNKLQITVTDESNQEAEKSEKWNAD